jgi:hypothetical protein
MKLKILLALGAFLVAASGTAEAKFTSYRLTIDGPGMGSPGTIHERRSIDRVSMATLVGTHRTRTERPQSPGPAYLLEFGFGVSDENGSRSVTIRQTLYPFAAGGPVVLTPRRQKIDMSYGSAHFAPGSFQVLSWVLHRLERVGLPHTPPEPDPDPTTPARLDPPSVGLRGVLGLAVLAVGAGAVAARRRQLTEAKDTRRQ